MQSRRDYCRVYKRPLSLSSSNPLNRTSTHRARSYAGHYNVKGEAGEVCNSRSISPPTQTLTGSNKLYAVAGVFGVSTRRRLLGKLRRPVPRKGTKATASGGAESRGGESRFGQGTSTRSVSSGFRRQAAVPATPSFRSLNATPRRRAWVARHQTNVPPVTL
jgi:hypothetical protein